MASAPAGQLGQRQLASLGGVIGDHAWRRGARDQPPAAYSRQPPRHPARLVSRRAVLLVCGRPLLVQDDETEAWDGREHRRPAAEDDIGLAAPDAPPLLRTLEL